MQGKFTGVYFLNRFPTPLNIFLPEEISKANNHPLAHHLHCFAV